MHGGVIPSGVPGPTRCAMWKLTACVLTTTTSAHRRRWRSSPRSTDPGAVTAELSLEPAAYAA